VQPDAVPVQVEVEVLQVQPVPYWHSDWLVLTEQVMGVPEQRVEPAVLPPLPIVPPRPVAPPLP
jgi:hypothetical protein